MEFRKTLDVSTVEIIFLSGVVIRYGQRRPWRYLGSRGGRYVKKELKSAEREREKEREKERERSSSKAAVAGRK